MKKKILIILPGLPYPLDSGGNQGAYHMIDAINDCFDVYLWYLSDYSIDKKTENEFLDSLSGKCKIFHTVKEKGLNIATARGIHYKVDSFLLRKNLEFRHNKTIWGKETSSRFDNYILEDIRCIIVKNKIDAVQIEFTDLMDYVYALPSYVKKIFVHHELGFARKKTLLANIPDKSAYDEFMFNRSLAREISTLNQYDTVVALTEIDKNKLIHEGVSVPVKVSPLFIPRNCKDYPNFMPSENRLSFIASGAHYPNVEGLLWFINEVHPILATKIRYELYIIGSKWEENIISKVPSNMHFMGFVRELKNAVPGSVMIVPILSGSGMRMKILESVNNSVPFVSTSVGVEGLNFTNSIDCYIEDNPREFAEKICYLLNHVEKQRSFVMNSRKIYESLYSEDVLSNIRLDILNSILV